MESGSSVVAVSDEVEASSTAVVRAHLASGAFDLAHPIAFPLRVLAPFGSWGMGGATSIVRVDAISSDEKPFSPVGCTMSCPADEAAVRGGTGVFRGAIPP